MNTQATTFPTIQQIAKHYPQFAFNQADTFFWSPEKSCVYYIEDSLFHKKGWFQLFHELGHAVCDHRTFHSGVQLLKIEAEAWKQASEIATEYRVSIPQTYIEQALDSYRDWLHQRSLCPECHQVCIESKPNHYHCHHCSQNWTVPSHQQTRCYRKKIN